MGEALRLTPVQALHGFGGSGIPFLIGLSGLPFADEFSASNLARRRCRWSRGSVAAHYKGYKCHKDQANPHLTHDILIS